MNMDCFLTIKCILPTDRNNMYVLISDYYRVNVYCTQHTNWKKIALYRASYFLNL